MAGPEIPPLRSCVFSLTEAEHYVPWRLGRGDFLLGVRKVVGVARQVPLVPASQQRNSPVMLATGPKREFVETIEAADADFLIQFNGAVGAGLRVAIDMAWPHVAPVQRDDLIVQFQQRAHLAPRAVLFKADKGLKYVGGTIPGYQPTLESFVPRPRRVKSEWGWPSDLD